VNFRSEEGPRQVQKLLACAARQNTWTDLYCLESRLSRTLQEIANYNQLE
jgi:hypothetical protein